VLFRSSCKLCPPSLGQPHHYPLWPVNRQFSNLGHALELLRRIAVPRLALPKAFRRQPGLEARSLPSRRRRYRCARPRIVQRLALASIHGVTLVPVFRLIVAGQRARGRQRERFRSHIKIRGRHRNKVPSMRGGASQSAGFLTTCCEEPQGAQHVPANGQGRLRKVRAYAAARECCRPPGSAARCPARSPGSGQECQTPLSVEETVASKTHGFGNWTFVPR
jgi:hypothetical protein